MQNHEITSNALAINNKLPLNPLFTSNDLSKKNYLTIKVVTLGHFQIWCNNNLKHSYGKAQYKPLQLLKCLCAYGGYSISREKLIDSLWPDSEGDAGQLVFRITLHRLRKLLQQNEALKLENGYLSFNPNYIWVDCLAFDQITNSCEKNDLTLLEHSLNLYSGHFLSGESNSWALNFRNRLHTKYLSKIELLCDQYEQHHNWEAALDCYLKVLEIDPTAENIYYRLMKNLLHLGRRAEAIAFYRRCQKCLQLYFGIQPIQKTQDLYQKMVSDQLVLPLI